MGDSDPGARAISQPFSDRLCAPFQHLSRPEVCVPLLGTQLGSTPGRARGLGNNLDMAARLRLTQPRRVPTPRKGVFMIRTVTTPHDGTSTHWQSSIKRITWHKHFWWASWGFHAYQYTIKQPHGSFSVQVEGDYLNLRG